MIKVGLTGNIGSGKTWVCKIFEALGTPVYYADLEARAILNSPEIIKKIIDTFGVEVAQNQTEIDRNKLATIVFSDTSELNKLNALIHPKLQEHFLQWAQNHSHFPYVIQEAAILFENGFDKIMDQTITVSAPQKVRLERVVKRDGAKEQDVLARMDHQWSDEKKEQLANFVIYNDGEKMVLPQVLKIHQAFTK